MESDIHFKVTTNLNLIDQAKSLLYEHYINELQWKIQAHNPSAIKIVASEQKNILVDDYDGISTWFVGIKEQAVIACARLCSEDQNGLLEVERYINGQSTLKKILQEKHTLNLVELNRESIHFQYRNLQTYLLLFKTIIEHCITNKQSILMTTHDADLIRLYALISFPKLACPSFKYDPNETIPVNSYLANFHDNDHFRMIHKINFLLTQEKEYANNQTFSVA